MKTRLTLVLFAGLILVCSAGHAIMWAGTPLVDLNGNTITENAGEQITTSTNAASSSIGNFVADATGPSVEVFVSPVNAASTKVLNFHGIETLKGGNSFWGIHGGQDWSVEAWVLNPEILVPKTVVAWGNRDAGEGKNGALVYSSFLVDSAADHGGWNTSLGYYGGIPVAGKRHHICWTFEGSLGSPAVPGTESVYVDGILNATNSKVLAINAGKPVRVAGQNTTTGTLADGFRFDGKIAVVRIHDGVLDANQIKYNFEEEMANFGLTKVGSIVAGQNMDFGVRAGGSGPGNTQIVIVQNHPMAFGDLTFTEAITVLGPFELVDPAPVYDTLVPGATMEFGIAFNPVDDNPVCGVCIIRTNDADGDFWINLRGNQQSLEDDFSTPHDYITDGVTGTMWDGAIKNTLADLNMFNTTDNPGYLKIGGMTGTNSWDDNNAQGVFLYKEVTGDFIADMEIADASGPGYGVGNCPFTDVGLMVRLGDPAQGGPGEDAFWVDWFPAWGCSNLVRGLQNGMRADVTGGAAGEENACKFIQVERVGNGFICRVKKTAADVWIDHPVSPYIRTDMDGLPVQVGICYSTFTLFREGALLIIADFCDNIHVAGNNS